MSAPNTQAQEQAPPPPKKVHKKHAAHGHHGGAWKVAYADFITTLMALFLVLWLLSATDQTTKSLVAAYFRDPGVFENTQGPNLLYGSGLAKRPHAVPIVEVTGPGRPGQGSSDHMLTLEHVTDGLRKALHASGAKMGLEQAVVYYPQPDGLELQLVDNAQHDLFEPGRSAMRPGSRMILTQLGVILSLISGYELSVGGHTDSQQFSLASVYTNWDLSLDRAQEAAAVLVEAGVPVQRITSVTGYADAKPFASSAPFEPRNRRVTIRIRMVNNNQGEHQHRPGDGDRHPGLDGKVSGPVAAEVQNEIKAELPLEELKKAGEARAKAKASSDELDIFGGGNEPVVDPSELVEAAPKPAPKGGH